MKKEVSELDTDVEILFLMDEDKLLNHDLLRYIYIMSRKLSDESEHITVRAVDLSRDPTAADAFKTAQGTSIRTSDVIVHSGGRYKILSADSFFGVDSDTGSDAYISFNGEYRLATAILSVGYVVPARAQEPRGEKFILSAASSMRETSRRNICA